MTDSWTSRCSRRRKKRGAAEAAVRRCSKRQSRMGFSITWCAVREEGAQKLLEQLGLSPTGKTEEFPESLISTAKLDTGWRVIWYNEYGCPFLRPDDLGSISSEQDVLLCLVEEHVMASSLEMWSGGKRKWYFSQGRERRLPCCNTGSAIGSPMKSMSYP